MTTAQPSNKKNKLKNRLAMYKSKAPADQTTESPAAGAGTPGKTDGQADEPPATRQPAESTGKLEIDGLVLTRPDKDGPAVLESRLAFDQNYGRVNYNRYRPFRLSDILQWEVQTRRERSNLVLPEECLFLDFETTGLSTGSGTVPFLTGAGYFTPDGYVCRQYFLPTPAAEKAMLEDLLELAARFKFLFTFNGKTFDLPLLKSRLVYNFRDRPAFPLEHFDIYHLLKRIFKGSVERHRLQSYEENLLGITRLDDVPGAEIPQLYFDYVRYGHEKRLASVFIHNQLDIFSLSFFVLETIERLKNPADLQVSIRTNLAKILHRNRRSHDALRLLEDIEPEQFTHSHSFSELFFQALLNKRLQRFERCTRLLSHGLKALAGLLQHEKQIGRLLTGEIHQLFTDLLDSLTERPSALNPSDAEPDSPVGAAEIMLYLAMSTELAKLYEHRFRQYDRALCTALGALEAATVILEHWPRSISSMKSGFKTGQGDRLYRGLEREKKNLVKRAARLRNRLSRIENAGGDNP